MKKLRVLLLGGGGREHALAWKMIQSSRLEELFVAPGNGGTANIAKNLGFADTDFDSLKNALIANSIDLLVVGPEAPLVKGVRAFVEKDDALSHIRVLGPGQEGAQLEGSKSFSKLFMQRHGIPTARFGEFSANQLPQAQAFLNEFEPPYVLKADGLAAGKGVLIIEDKEEAQMELKSMLQDGKFGAAGEKVVIEEFLKGIELSVFILTDGKSYALLPEAKDYKRIGEGDVGLNTGGMGSISPVSFAQGEFLQKVTKQIIDPTIEGLNKDKIPYNGFLFIGLMNVGGNPYVIEYNCRMGDPETESVLPRIKNDLLEAMWNTAGNEAERVNLEIDERTAACVMTVSGGYPEAYQKGKSIHGLNQIKDALVFHAGTKESDDGIVTSGGRVIAITGLGDDLEKALKKSYENVEKLSFDGMHYRKDIGRDLM